MFAKSKEEYEWLQQSTFNFPDKQTLKGLFFEADLTISLYVAFTGGVVQCTLAIKKQF